MLFHVTLTHSENNCAVYHREMLPGILAAFENMEALGRELNTKPHHF